MVQEDLFLLADDNSARRSHVEGSVTIDSA